MNQDIKSVAYAPGQRWASYTEPELGLGVIKSINEQHVVVAFPACEETRCYSLESPPLNRITFQVGSIVLGDDNVNLSIKRISEAEGLLTYHGEAYDLPEQDLHSSMSNCGPEERLKAGQTSDNTLFDLRQDALNLLFKWRKSPVRGLLGAKVNLIPHQLFIAHEVSNRQFPRVLLADEVGLGKTIEACLILNRLIINGRAKRVLILLPNSLVNQWFVELLRRFNRWFSIYDEERCAAIEKADTDGNPFEDDQLILASIDWLSKSPKRMEQCVQASWDLLIVDEAHHLKWTANRSSEKYDLVHRLGEKVKSILLLTATPHQLGFDAHFARLHLLDANRFPDLGSFGKEMKKYTSVAKICKKLTSKSNLQRSDLDNFQAADTILTRAKAEWDKSHNVSESTKAELIRDIADRHGTGRVLFRNTRKSVQGFPKRLAKFYPLPPSSKTLSTDNSPNEFKYDIGLIETEPKHVLTQDPRIEWLTTMLTENKHDKFLLICSTKAKLLALEEAVRNRINLKLTVFHEDLTLIQRDRNAAWFSEEEGARLLICSEIGSEGRNFQFCRHLVMFDFPLNAELIEQRIGRLDRIGQTKDIHIHIPFIKSSCSELLTMWLHRGLNAFEESFLVGQSLVDKYKPQLIKHFNGTSDNFEELIQKTATDREFIKSTLREGMDQLLELNSHISTISSKLVQLIQKFEKHSQLESFTLKLFDYLGLEINDIGLHAYRLGNTERLPISLPESRSGTFSLTFDRTQAASRDDLMFMSCDHPVVSACADQLLGSNDGTAVFAHWQSESAPALYLETVFVLECLAPSELNANRFLAPTPIRIVVNHLGKAATDLDGKFITAPQMLKNIPSHLISRSHQLTKLIPIMMQSCDNLASKRSKELALVAIETMQRSHSTEIERLTALALRNKNIRKIELTSLVEAKERLTEILSEARIRIDSVRLIWRGSLEKLMPV